MDSMEHLQKLQQQSLCDVVFLEHPQEVELLLGFFQRLLTDHIPGQDLLDVDTLKAEIQNLIHIVPLNDEWGDVVFVPPL